MTRFSKARTAFVVSMVLLVAGGCTYGIKQVDLEQQGDYAWVEAGTAGHPSANSRVAQAPQPVPTPTNQVVQQRSYAAAQGSSLQAPITRMQQPNAYAIVIGVEKYRGKIPDAQHAASDASAVASYMKRTLGVPERNIKVLVNDLASKGDIDAVLKQWLPRQLKKKRGPVYFYFSGHGTPEPTSGKAYLLPYDGDPEYLSTKGIQVDDLYASLRGVNAEHVAVFIDACFAGGGPRSVMLEGARPLVPVKQAKVAKGKMFSLTASAANQIANSSRSVPHGLFTTHLLRGMGGLADRDGDRKVSLHELNIFVKRHVEREARDINQEQTPSLSQNGIGKPGNFVIVEGLVDP